MFVAGVDYSQEMVEQAAHRNAEAVARGQVGSRKATSARCPTRTLRSTRSPASRRSTSGPTRWPGCARCTACSSRGAGHDRGRDEPGGRAQKSALQRYLSERYAKRAAGIGQAIYSGPQLVGLLEQAGFRTPATRRAPTSPSAGCADRGPGPAESRPMSAHGAMSTEAAPPRPRQAPGPRGLFLLGSILDFKRDILPGDGAGWREYGDPSATAWDR